MASDDQIKKLEAELARLKAEKDREARIEIGGKILPIGVLNPFQTLDTIQMWIEEEKERNPGLTTAAVLTFGEGGGFGVWAVFGSAGKGIQLSTLLWSAEEIKAWCLRYAAEHSK